MKRITKDELSFVISSFIVKGKVDFPQIGF